MTDDQSEDPAEHADDAAESGTDADENEEVDADADAESTEEQAGIAEGDFVRVAYTARTVENDQLVDTTDEEIAEEEGVDDQQETFEPRVIAVGAGHLFDSVEEDFVGGEAGESGSVTVPATEAFGEYDESEVRTVSAEKLPEDDQYPGAQVQVDGEQGFVNTIIGGRARVDFNHPLAGEDVEYDYEVLDTVEDRIERAQGLLGMYLDADLEMRIEVEEVEEERMVEPDEDEDGADDREDGESDADDGSEEEADEEEEIPGPDFETEVVEKETLYIEQSPELQFDQQWMMGKQQILGDVIDRLDLDRVIVEEVIDGSGGMMGGMGGMMGGMGGPGGAGGGGESDIEGIEEELADADVDADEIVEELEGEEEAGGVEGSANADAE